MQGHGYMIADTCTKESEELGKRPIKAKNIANQANLGEYLEEL